MAHAEAWINQVFETYHQKLVAEFPSLDEQSLMGVLKDEVLVLIEDEVGYTGEMIVETCEQGYEAARVRIKTKHAN